MLFRKYSKSKEILSIIMQVFFITIISLICVFPLSCKATPEGIEIIGGDYNPPKIESFSVLGENSVQLEFSEEVNLKNIVISPKINGISDSMVSSKTVELSPAISAACGERGRIESSYETDEENKVFTFSFLENTQVGKSYEIFGVVEDNIGNSLTFCIPFTGYNEKVANIIMTELQIRYAKAALKDGDIYRNEYVEFLALTDGNLSGLELIGAYDGEKKKYVFPPIEVEKGQIFLVHLRKAGAGCINEQGDYDEAFAEYSKEGILDLWSENESSRFNDSADVVYIKNTVNNTIVDGIMYALPSDFDWKVGIGEKALELEEAGIVDSCGIENAVISQGTSPKKSLNRVDASNIYEKLLNGEEIEYPIMMESSSWIVSEAKPGQLL